MERLSDEVGQPVRSAGGSLVGRVVDLTVRLGDAERTVHRLAIGRGTRVRMLVPWDAVAWFGASEVRLRPGAEDEAEVVEPPPAPLPLAVDELLLVRDVLDTQIVDVVGERLVRVGDVLLEPDVGGRRHVLAVDVGWGAVVRRLGLRRAGDRLTEEAVDWHDLHLTSARGHTVQLATTRATVHRLGPDELAVLVSRIPTSDAVDVLASMSPERAAAALAASTHDTRHRVVLAMGEQDASRVVEHLPEPHAHRFRDLLAGPRPMRRRLTRHRPRLARRVPRAGDPGA